MRHRRRHCAALLVAAAIACAGLLPLAGPAAAATIPNTCTPSPIDVAIAGTATVNGSTVTLSGLTVTTTSQESQILLGYVANALQVGANTIPTTLTVTIGATGATPASAVLTKSQSITITITDPTPATRNNGDEHVTTGLSGTTSLQDTTWTATAGSVAFREVSLKVAMTLPLLGPIEVSCTPTNAAQPFATATTGASTSSSSTSSTSSSSTSSSSTSSSTTTTTLTGSSTTATTPSTAVSPIVVSVPPVQVLGSSTARTPAVAATAASGTGSGSLAATGLPSLPLLAAVVAFLDVGYLLLSASRPDRR